MSPHSGLLLHHLHLPLLDAIFSDGSVSPRAGYDNLPFTSEQANDRDFPFPRDLDCGCVQS